MLTAATVTAHRGSPSGRFQTIKRRQVYVAGASFFPGNLDLLKFPALKEAQNYQKQDESISWIAVCILDVLEDFTEHFKRANVYLFRRSAGLGCHWIVCDKTLPSRPFEEYEKPPACTPAGIHGASWDVFEGSLGPARLASACAEIPADFERCQTPAVAL